MEKKNRRSFLRTISGLPAIVLAGGIFPVRVFSSPVASKNHSAMSRSASDDQPRYIELQKSGELKQYSPTRKYDADAAKQAAKNGTGGTNNAPPATFYHQNNYNINQKQKPFKTIESQIRFEQLCNLRFFFKSLSENNFYLDLLPPTIPVKWIVTMEPSREG